MIVCFFIFLFNLFLYADSLPASTIEIESKHLSIDDSLKLILVNKELKELNDSKAPVKSFLVQDQLFHFALPIQEFQTGQNYLATNENHQTYHFQITQLPVLKISHSLEIIDEPKIPARLFLVESSGKVIESFMGIELRGGWAQSVPKKSFRIETWKDSSGTIKKDIQPLQLRKDDDWNLQALFNEPLKVRSKVNHELWRKFNSLHYSKEEPQAINGIRQEFIEVFLNNRYQGLYSLSERIDRKQLKLKKNKKSEMRGELYKGILWGASTYDEAPKFDNSSKVWSGFEYEYPKDTTNWDNLFQFVDFVVNEDSLSFVENYTEYFEIQNAVDYFLFLNFLRATDNTGKNLYMAKYKANDPYFFLPWDLDGTLGILYDGSTDTTTNDILSNGFYNRLLLDSNFIKLRNAKWNSLRDFLSANWDISTIMEEKNYLESNGVYLREAMVYPSENYLDSNNLEFTEQWLKKRIQFLDSLCNYDSKVEPDSENRKGFSIRTESSFDLVKMESEKKISRVTLSTVQGKPLFEKSPNSHNFEMETTNFIRGAYLLLIQTENKKFYVKKIQLP